MKKILFSLALISTVFVAGHAYAQTTPPFCQNGTCTYIALEPLPISGYSNCYGGPNTACSNPVQFQNLVTQGFKLLLGLGATIAVVMLVLGALTYMFSDVLKNKVNALSRIRNAMWAVVLLVSSYLILNTINPDLVNFSFNPTLGTVQTPTSTAGTPSTATAPNNTVTTGTISTAVQNAVCGTGGSCSTMQNYIVYDPNANTVQAQMDRNNFVTDCETAHYDSQTNTNRLGRVATFPASVVGGGNLTGAACVLQ